MKKLLLITCAVGMLSVAAMAQKANFSGTWSLDVPNSKLDARQRIESQTLTVTQTDKELKVATATKRLPPNDAPAGPPAGGGGGMGRGMGMGGDATVTYSLDGKEVKTEVEGPMGKMPMTQKATAEADGSLKLSTSRTFTGPNGEVTSTTTETWKLSADGKSLTVTRESTGMRGPTSSTFVYTKK